jgi:hypothetical protein
MNVIFTLRSANKHYRDEDRSAPVDFLPPDNRRTTEIDEAARQVELEQAIRKAIAQLRRSVKLPNPPEDGLYLPISGRRVSPSVGRFFAGRISRCHQRS